MLTHCSLQDYPAPRWLLSVPRYPGIEARIKWAQAYLGRLFERLEKTVSVKVPLSTYSTAVLEDKFLSDGLDYQRTPFCDFSKCQARASLEFNILGEDECAQCSKWFAGEKVGFTALRKLASATSRCQHPPHIV